MGMRCLFKHQFGLPRLDETGVVMHECMACGHTEPCRATLVPDNAVSESMAARRARAITLLGERWVGRPTKNSASEDDRAA